MRPERHRRSHPEQAARLGLQIAGGALGGLAWVAIGRVREDAAMTSLAPGEPAPSTANSEKVSGATA